ncbi:hypothetical protein BSK56_31780 [Paenibacillus borealis]|uniref:Proteinase inhibitor I42 chagasin domain-containing protein n=1 Tax=Paenibacillus borealis TaxID=160799 RepID=A0ABX3GXE8_PAEBO|nr:protease inhibitor I42 family protein [Paenibacillus borealis]OMD36959.1 hypothetical protein BSK56_31780 [Paenibacillus borealis]
MKITKSMITAACLASCLSAGSMSLAGKAFANISPVKVVDNVKVNKSNKSVQESGHVKKVAAGETFEITLEENASTGYSWSYAADGDTLELIAEKSKYPEQTDPPMVGVASQKTWTFKATKAGTYTLKFTYTQAWEKDQKPAQTVNYTIQVNKQGANGSKAAKQQPLAVLKTGKVNTVKAGQPFHVKLEENTTTGYSWSYDINSNAVNLIAEENRFPAPINVDGAPGEKIWTFKAKKAGTYTLKFTYIQSWEKEQKPAQTVTYTVKVN